MKTTHTTNNNAARDEGQLKKGDRVKIMNTTMSGETVVEGVAIITSKTTVEGYYNVRFGNEAQVFARFCDPANKL